MALLTEEMKELFREQNMYHLATANARGIPNVIPLRCVKIYDDETILICDNYFNKTLENMRENPAAAICIWKPKHGYQIKGRVEIHEKGEIFEYNLAWMKGFKPDAKPKTAILFRITEIYSLDPGENAGERIV